MERAVEKKRPPRMKATNRWNVWAMPASWTLATEVDIADAAVAPCNIGSGMSFLEYENGGGGVNDAG